MDHPWLQPLTLWQHLRSQRRSLTLHIIFYLLQFAPSIHHLLLRKSFMIKIDELYSQRYLIEISNALNLRIADANHKGVFISPKKVMNQME